MNSFAGLEDWLNKIVSTFSKYVAGTDPRIILVFILSLICALCILKIFSASFRLFVWSLVLVVVAQPIPWLLIQIQKLPMPSK